MAARVHPFRIGGPAAASLLVNALLMAGLLSLGMGQVSRKTERSSLTVMSLAAVKGAEEAEDKPDAPAEPRKPVEPPAEAADIRPEASVQPPVAPASPVAILPVASSHAKAPAATPAAMPSPPPQATAAQQAAAVAPSSPPPARRGTAEGLNVKAPPGTSNSYAAKVRSWLYAHKIYPRRAKMRREEGKVRVRFVIDRAGMLVEGVLIDRSGNDTLDEEATAMMRRASPYPKAPPEIPGDRLEFVVPIEFTLPV